MGNDLAEIVREIVAADDFYNSREWGSVDYEHDRLRAADVRAFWIGKLREFLRDREVVRLAGHIGQEPDEGPECGGLEPLE